MEVQYKNLKGTCTKIQESTQPETFTMPAADPEITFGDQLSLSVCFLVPRTFFKQ